MHLKIDKLFPSCTIFFYIKHRVTLPMDIKKIKRLIELLEQSGISEIEIKEGKESIKLCKSNQGMTPLQQIQPMIVSSPPFNSNTHANFINHHTIKNFNLFF